MILRNKNIFMTGGAGFIGAALIARLIQNNDIIVYDTLQRNALKYTDLLKYPNLTVVQGNVLDRDKLTNTVEDCDVVVHLAAIAGIASVIKSPINTMEVNMIGTYNVLKAIEPRIEKIERFIYFSTSEVFGSYAYKAKEIHTTNLAPVGEARWTYSVSKLAAEHLVHSYYREFALPAVTIRPFNIYGPGQVGEGAIHVFVTRALEDLEIQIHGEGDQIRSWCYIDDIIQGIMFCLEKDEAIGEVFNIGNPRGTLTILSLAEKVVQLCESKSKIVFVPKHYIDVDLRIPSIEKAINILGFKPEVDLDDGLKRTIEWYRKKIDSSKKT